MGAVSFGDEMTGESGARLWWPEKMAILPTRPFRGAGGGSCYYAQWEAGGPFDARAANRPKGAVGHNAGADPMQAGLG